jgi:lipopolysaccharide biosynthesis glycosyltransferase
MLILINLDRVRIEGTFSATIDFLQRHGQDLAFNDQDALNCVFWNRWRPLDIIWNVQRHMVISSLEKDLSVDKRLNGRYPALVHYTGPEKPWLPKGYHPWAWLYWKNLAQTPFASEVANSNNMNFYRRIRLWQRWLRQRPSQIGAWH